MRQTVVVFGCLVFFSVLNLPFAALQAQQSSDSAATVQELPNFEVASIKPSKAGYGHHNWDGDSYHVTIENYCLRDLIVYAWNLKSDSQVLGGPGWISNKHFDIAAKVDDAELRKLKAMDRDEVRNQWNQMMQSLLTDRFGLKVRHDRRTVTVYALVIAKSGQKLAPATGKETNYRLSGRNSRLTATAVSMAALADYLNGQTETEGRVVVDHTGLTGSFDFNLEWTPDRGNGISPDAQFPGLFTALREQLGLVLKPAKAPVEVVMVESATEPEPD